MWEQYKSTAQHSNVCIFWYWYSHSNIPLLRCIKINVHSIIDKATMHHGTDLSANIFFSYWITSVCAVFYCNLMTFYIYMTVKKYQRKLEMLKVIKFSKRCDDYCGLINWIDSHPFQSNPVHLSFYWILFSINYRPCTAACFCILRLLSYFYLSAYPLDNWKVLQLTWRLILLETRFSYVLSRDKLELGDLRENFSVV